MRRREIVEHEVERAFDLERNVGRQDDASARSAMGSDQRYET